MGIRSLVKGYVPDKSFLIVAMVANLFFLVGWRMVYASKAVKTQTAPRPICSYPLTVDSYVVGSVLVCLPQLNTHR